MFRLMKLAVLALLGYAIYEFFRGLTGSEIGQQPGQSMGGEGQQRAHRGAAKMQFSGPGEGQREETEESSGTATPHYVGRGVVQR